MFLSPSAKYDHVIVDLLAFSSCRAKDVAEPESSPQLDDLRSVVSGNEEDEKLQVKIQAFEEKINVDNSTPDSVRRYSLGQVSKEERKDIRFSRYASLQCVSGFAC